MEGFAGTDPSVVGEQERQRACMNAAEAWTFFEYVMPRGSAGRSDRALKEREGYKQSRATTPTRLACGLCKRLTKRKCESEGETARERFEKDKKSSRRPALLSFPSGVRCLPPPTLSRESVLRGSLFIIQRRLAARFEGRRGHDVVRRLGRPNLSIHGV